jgi:hypothetical protein
MGADLRLAERVPRSPDLLVEPEVGVTGARGLQAARKRGAQ